ncbi:MAG: D-glycerate dehydrogenase [Polyangiales bacterium]|nr:D-glycerate dehydrogenase [Myxococcales bacterium]MCB9659332.1 D-glycerate dehydrogenase [Sandaracinaceae bacterium]
MPTLVLSRDLPFGASFDLRQATKGLDVRTVAHGRSAERDELLHACRDADALVTMLSDRIDAEFMAACPQLRVIANYAVGYDNLDLHAAARTGIVLTNTPDVLTEATADIAFALVLGVARRVREGERLLRAGEFHGWRSDMLLGTELHGRVFGLIGMGRIGAATARRARGFGMRVHYCNRNPVSTELTAELGATRRSLDELLAEADVLSVHCPLTPETHHLLNAARLAQLKPGAILINTARGPVVDEAALVDALERGALRGAGLDVYEHEPRVHPGLLHRDDVMLLPHLGSATTETRAVMAELALRNCVAVLQGRPPETPITLPTRVA